MPTTEGKRIYMYLKCGKDKITTTTTTGQDRAGQGSTTLLAEPPSLLRNEFSAGESEGGSASRVGQHSTQDQTKSTQAQHNP